MQGPEVVAPARAEEAERRAAERDRLGQLVSVRWKHEGTPHSATGILQDFSLNGLLFECGGSLRASLPRDSEVVCRFHTPSHLPYIGDRTVTCEGRVSRINELPGQQGHIGIAVTVHTVSVL